MTKIAMKKVTSSNIDAIGYDEKTKELHVKFAASGKTYSYPGVDSDLHRRLLGSESVGSFFHRHIKGKFDGTLVP
jgi:hypothetical protein